MTIYDFVRPADQREFDRIKAAKRGTFRTERAEDYVIIAHCHTVDYIAVAPVSYTVWYVSVNYNGDPIRRAEFDDLNLTYDAFEAFIVGVIVAHQKARQTLPATR